MALVNSAFTVNVTPGAMPPTVHVSEYDIGRTYTVTINGQNGSAFNIPTGTTATVEGTLNGAIGFTTDATISGSTVSFTLTESMTARSGKAWCKIKLTLNDEPIQTCAFVLAVDRAGVEAETVIGAPGFEEQIAEAAAEWLEEQGFSSPTIDVTEITGGHRVTITDAEHPQGQSFAVMNGEDYVLTSADKQEIAGEVSVDPTAFAPTVTDWLDENVTPVGSAVVVDSSLMVSGAAADAAVVGNLINGTAAEVLTPLEVTPWLLKSTIDSSGRAVINDNSAVSIALSENFYSVAGGTVLKFAGDTEDGNGVALFSYVHEYNSSNVWLRRTAFNSSNDTTTVGNDCTSVRFTFQRASSTGVTMTQNDIDEHFSVLIYREMYGGGLVSRVEALEGATIETDDTLSIEGAAADAKATGDGIRSIRHLLGETEDADLTEDVSNFYISSSLNTWGSNSNTTSAFVTIPANAKSVTVTANSTANAVIAILKSDNREVEQVPQYAEGCNRTVITAGHTEEVEIPSDGAFLYVLLTSGNSVYQPASAVFKFQSLIVETDKTLSVEDAPADAATVGEILYGSSEEGSGEPEEITVGSWTIGQNIASDGSITQNYPKGAFTTSIIPTIPNTVFYYTGLLQDTNNAPLYVRVVEYNDLGNFIVRSNVFTEESRSYTVGDSCYGVRFSIISAESNMTQNIIDSCFGVAMGQNVNRKGVIERVDDLESALAAIRLGLHTTPENSGVLNLIKRCRQMTDIKWTPAVDLPRYMFPSISPDRGGDYTANQVSDYIGVFKAGVEYTGIPYGRCTSYIPNYGISDSYVGITISIESFVTAIQNENSIISKESQGSLSDHRSIPYALVCSALASYALNVPYTATASIPSISGMSSVGKVVDNGVRFDAKGIKLGDLLINTEVHSAVITDIVTDEEGEVTAIEISEATTVGEANPDVEGGQVGGICRRHGLSIEDFYAYWASYTLYRYSGIANIPYTPSKYVNVGDELNYSKFVDLPCMPYTGEGFVYHAGSIPNTKILVNASGFSFMRVFKDGTEISGSPFAVASGAEYVSVGFSAVGNYSAYLCNMSNGTNTKVTQKCHWSVV